MHIILLKKKQSVKQTNRPISGPIRSDPVIRPDPVNTRTKNWQSFSYIRRTCGEMGGGGVGQFAVRVFTGSDLITGSDRIGPEIG